MGTIKALYKEPGKKLQEIEIKNTLEAMQAAVGGYIEALTLDRDLALICDEEGKIKGRAFNATVAWEDIVGPFLVLGIAGDDFADCPITPEEFTNLYMCEEE